MRIAVITPYFKEPVEKLLRCHESVKAQDIREDMALDHLFVADGFPHQAVDGWDATHVKLPVNCGDSGDTPRLIGMAMVSALGYDGLLFLDADNWYEAGHVSTLVALHRASGAGIVTCARMLRRPDGSLLGTCAECDGSTFCDFNCYFFARQAFISLRVLAFSGRNATYFTDRYLYDHIKTSCVPLAHSSLPTVNYETRTISHYHNAGEAPPAEATEIVYFKTEKKWRKLNATELDALFLSKKIHLTPMYHNMYPKEAEI